MKSSISFNFWREAAIPWISKGYMLTKVAFLHLSQTKPWHFPALVTGSLARSITEMAAVYTLSEYHLCYIQIAILRDDDEHIHRVFRGYLIQQVLSKPASSKVSLSNNRHHVITSLLSFSEPPCVPRPHLNLLHNRVAPCYLLPKRIEKADAFCADSGDVPGNQMPEYTTVPNRSSELSTKLVSVLCCSE